MGLRLDYGRQHFNGNADGYEQRLIDSRYFQHNNRNRRSGLHDFCSTHHGGSPIVTGGYSCTIAVSETIEVDIEFDPTSSALHTDVLSIDHNGINVGTPVNTTLEGRGETTLKFNYTGAIVNWTVPAVVTTVTIEVWGAQGARAGGKGARMKGDFTVTPGEVLKILVGEIGDNGDNTRTYLGGGGGGGSFVTRSNNSPLIIAGGGGGRTTTSAGATHGTTATMDGRITTDGGDTFSNGGGNNGEGGKSGFTVADGSGGGGLLTKGEDCPRTGTGGEAFINGGAGGAGSSTPDPYGGDGGFGGGGGGYTNAFNRGGGGGGYSGGQGGYWSGQPSGGGGGSINNGTNQDNAPGVQSGNGQVVIRL